MREFVIDELRRGSSQNFIARGARDTQHVAVEQDELLANAVARAAL